MADDVRKEGKAAKLEESTNGRKVNHHHRILPFISKAKHSRSKKQGFTVVAEIFIPADNLDCRYLDCALSGGNSLQTFF